MKYTVECLSCWRKYHVVDLRPRYCAECGAELTEGCLVEELELTRGWLAQQPYEVPEGTPNIHEFKDAFDLNEVTGIGYTKCRKILIAVQERGMVFEKPVDLLKVGGIGMPSVKKVIGKVAFGRPDTEERGALNES